MLCHLHVSGHDLKNKVSPPPSTNWKSFFSAQNNHLKLLFFIQNICHFWLAPIPQQILLNQLVLPYLMVYYDIRTSTIDQPHFLAWPPSYSGVNQKRRAFKATRRRFSQISKKLSRRNAIIRKTYKYNVIYIFEEYLQGITSIYILKPWWEIGQSLKKVYGKVSLLRTHIVH